MLEVHGASVVPFYLSSLASHQHISEDDCFDWYIDLLTSTLLVEGNYYRQGIKLSHPFGALSQPENFIDKVDYLGTSPSLLKLIRRFLSFSTVIPMLSFKAARYEEINEISSSSKLLEFVLIGNIQMRRKLQNIGIEYSQITGLMQEQLKTSEKSYKNFIQPSNKKNIRPIRDFHTPRQIQVKHDYIYHLFPEEPRRVEKETIYNGEVISKEILACKHPKKVNDSHYLCGYGGSGVYNMAYTILFDLFNTKRLSKENIFPTDSEEELVVYKLLSRIYECFKYSISSKQIIHALSEPIISEPEELNQDIVLAFLKEI